VIAAFAEAIRPAARALPDEQARTLGELVTRRRQLVDMYGAELNRRRLVRDRQVQQQLAAHVRWLEQALVALERELQQTIRATPVWREAEDLLRSVPGIGPVTAFTLLADLPELGRLPRSPNRRAGRSRPGQSRQRHPAWSAHRRRRPGPCPTCAVHGDGQRDPAQSADWGVLSTAAR
jgi:hypothetical protein